MSKESAILWGMSYELSSLPIGDKVAKGYVAEARFALDRKARLIEEAEAKPRAPFRRSKPAPPVPLAWTKLTLERLEHFCTDDPDAKAAIAKAIVRLRAIVQRAETRGKA